MPKAVVLIRYPLQAVNRTVYTLVLRKVNVHLLARNLWFSIVKQLLQEQYLDPTLIKGKIVVCMIETVTDSRRQKSIFVREGGGGIGMILIDPSVIDIGFQFVKPSTLISQEEAQELQAYMTTEK